MNASTPDGANRWCFGAFTLDQRKRQLLHRGVPVSIGSRAFDLLTALVEHGGQLATKDALVARVWPGTVVEENNLAAQMVSVRKILSADPALSMCLQTVPGRGYRFVADVTVADSASTAAPDVGSDALSLVVLPFTSLSNDLEQAHYAQGLSHTIATDLSRIAGLLVIAPATASTFEGRNVDARRVSRELGVQYVLTGSLQRLQNQLRINAHLIDGASGRQVWSELFDGDWRDLLALQDRITGRIANSIGREIFVAAARGGVARQIDPNSFDLLMRGIAADNRPQSLEILQQQEALFARAVELDTRNADAHARLARAILLRLTQIHSFTEHDQALLERGVIAAETSVALAPDNPRAHCAMGLLHVYRGDFERAVLANEAALALDRNFAIAHNNLGNSLVHLGRGAEALPAADTALRLDPLGPAVGSFWTTKGYAQLLLHANDDAVVSFKRAQSANPMLPRAHIGAAISLALIGDTDAAQRDAREVLRLVPRYRMSQTMDGSRPSSSPAYRQFFEDVLRPGAERSGLPI